MTHIFPTYDAYYKGYGLTKCSDGTFTALHDTPELYDEQDYPNIGLGFPVDQGKTYDCDSIRIRIDEVIAEREKRIGWVKEFSKTCKNPEWTERYLLDSCDPTNGNGHRSRSNHTEAEIYNIWYDGISYNMEWSMGCVTVSKTKFLYRKFLLGKGYITANN